MRENLRIGYANAGMYLHGGVNSSAVEPTALMCSGVNNLLAIILRSNELRQAILTAGSIKLSETQAIKLQLSCTVEIEDRGSPLYAPRT